VTDISFDIKPNTANGVYGSVAIADAHSAPLETWPNNELHDFAIHIEHPEYTALCPRSGYPDFGTIVIDYVPGPVVVELKAWKLYINSFRIYRISHESVVNEIADKLMNDVQPVALRVIGDFGRRGGVKMVVTVTRGDEYNFEPYTANTL
jgi:7-cyano-7-deazaguanine reductase